MASSQKEYSKEKLFGQVYTPNFIVCKILDEVGYNNKNILGKKILDPACGDGRFLVEIVSRVLKYSPKNQIKNNLLKIYGWDIDNDAINQCVNNLNQLINDYGIKINWNIKIKNSLHEVENNSCKYDFIVGNPPYIRIQHLEEKERKYIQNNFSFCNLGSTDIFIAFFELAKKLVTKNGICSYISPNSYFKTETGNKLRSYLSDNHIISIYDFGGIQIFDNATTYTCITTFSNTYNNNFIYYKAKNIDIFDSEIMNYNDLKITKFWQLGINHKIISGGTKLGDICKIFVGLATLCDKAYIFDFIEEDGDFLIVKTNFGGIRKIEKGILKPIIKVSRFKYQYILFPYEKINGKHKIIEEKVLMNNFPFAYKYLVLIKENLLKRSNGNSKKIKWYEFGRNQALDSSFGKKIVFSTMNEKPKFILIENEDSTFYSGYAIKYDGNYNELLKIINSKEMEDYINVAGKDLRGGWKSYNKKIVEEFRFEI